MTEHDFSYTKLNNRGLSLVELIIAFSMGVVIAGSIAALITFAIRAYQNEGVNTEMQYELQTNINMITDEIMGASAFAVVQNSGAVITDEGSPYTNYALFGNPHADITVGGAHKKGFKGVIFASSSAVSGKFKLYMNRLEKEIPTGTTLQAFAASEAGILSDQYLLGENLTQFVIEADPNHSSFDETDPAKMTYTNPIEVRVVLTFEKNGWGPTKKYNKHVDDISYMRNKAMDTIYVTGTDGVLKSFDLKKKEE